MLTGQLGDVMKESAQIALSYVRGHARSSASTSSAFEGHSEFHVHVPAGAIPKDGPSAGVTMVTALASLLSGRPVKHTVGMTGEVTLQGRVLPIGGLKQKALAAHAAGLTDVILPERNRGDLDEIPEEVREQMAFHPVMTIQEVLDRALEPARADTARKPSKDEPRARMPLRRRRPNGAHRDVLASRVRSPAAVSPFQSRSAKPRTCWSGAGSCRSSTPPSPARCASTSSPTPSPGSPRACSPSACATSRPPGLVQRTVIPSSPPTVEYRLTERGRRLGR